MSEEELNQELSTDDLKDVAGGSGFKQKDKNAFNGKNLFSDPSSGDNQFKQQQYGLRNDKKTGLIDSVPFE